MAKIDRKVWKKASAIGFAFTLLCLVACLIQYKADSNADTLKKIVRIGINFLAVNFFFYLFFNPLAFKAYALLLYIYGCENFIDGGNVLGAICISASFVFLSAAGILNKHKNIKIACLFVLPMVSILFQLFHEGKIELLISVMNILGAIFIVYLTWLIIIPKVEQIYSAKTEKILDENKFTKRDIEFLEHVLNGKKYSSIAALYDISESSVKAQMIELYHYLGLNSRTEFLAFCNGCSFILGNPETESK